MNDKLSEDVGGLMQSHLDHLTASAIGVDVIMERGYYSVIGRTQFNGTGFSRYQQRPTGIMIPLYGPDGSPAGFSYRPDKPRSDKSNKLVKYESVPDAPLRADTPPRCTTQIADPAIRLWVTEGAKKADALASAGECAININGVWGWRGKNPFGGTAILADFDHIPLKGRDVYLAFDADASTNIHVNTALRRLDEHMRRKGANVYVVNLPGADGAKTGVDDYLAAGHTIDELLALASKDILEIEAEPMAIHTPVYCIHEGQFCLIKNADGVKVKSPLCNFTAQIEGEVVRDDGLSEDRFYIVGGAMFNGEPLPAVEVPATSFAGLTWTAEKWGSKAIVNPGQTNKDHVRYLMQKSANDVITRRIYTHTGWREIDGEHVFLSGNGAIGRDDIEVELPRQLAGYNLPLNPAEINPAIAVKTSLHLMELGSEYVMFPLWAHAYLAPLGEFLNPAFTLWLRGASGSFKSAIVAVMLSHFGDFDYLKLPASWRDTANILERFSFQLKDVPFVIDDWFPGATPAEQKQMESKAETIIRAQGNRAGRARMRSDATARETYYPRGLVISNGEQIPGGESRTARIFVLDVEKTDIDPDMLTIAQKDAGLLKYATAHYIEWIGAHWGELSDVLPDKWASWRTDAFAEGTHARLPAGVAWLYSGLDTGLSFAQETGAIDHREAQEYRDRGWRIFNDLSLRQGLLVNAERPAARFIDAFLSLLQQKRLSIVPREQAEPTDSNPHRAFVGWETNEYWYLNPQAIYNAVYEYCNRGGEPFTFKREAVWSDLKRTGLIECEGGRFAKTTRVGNGERPKLINLDKKAIRVFVDK